MKENRQKLENIAVDLLEREKLKAEKLELENEMRQLREPREIVVRKERSQSHNVSLTDGSSSERSGPRNG